MLNFDKYLNANVQAFRPLDFIWRNFDSICYIRAIDLVYNCLIFCVLKSGFNRYVQQRPTLIQYTGMVEGRESDIVEEAK